MASPFLKNDVLALDDLQVRVIAILPEELALFDLTKPKAWPYWQKRDDLQGRFDAGEITLIQPDTYQAQLRGDSALKLPAKAQRDYRRRIIEPVVSDPTLRFLSLRPMEIFSVYFHDELPCSKNTILSLLRLFWKFGQVWNALVPQFHLRGVPNKPRNIGNKKLGRPRNGVDEERHHGINVDTATAAKLDAGLSMFGGKRSYRKVLELIIDRYFSETRIVDGLPTKVPFPQSQLPTVAQLKYRIQKIASRGEIIIKREGQDAFTHQRRDRTGSARLKATGPSSIYQIDSTLADIYLRGILNRRRLVGRPVVYLVVDVYSGMIVGFHVSLSPPNYESARCALMNAFTDKVAYCSEHNIYITDEQWPARFLCSELMTDRGADFTSYVLADAGGFANIKISYAARRRPDWKPMVEGAFEWLDADMTRWEPGATHARPAGSPSHPLDAIHTVQTFREMLINAILKFNARRIENVPSGFEVTYDHDSRLTEIFLRGMELEGAPRVPNLELVETALLPRVAARCSDTGLIVNGMAYRAASGFDRDWYVRQKGRKWPQFMAHFNPINADDVRLQIGRDTHLERFHLTPSYQSYRNWSVEECWDRNAARVSANRRVADEDNLANAKLKARQSVVRKRAAEERRQAGGKTVTDDIKSARREEHRYDTRSSKQQKAPSSDPEAEQADLDSASPPIQFQYVQPRSRLEMLKPKKP
jgi:putative transposase